MKKLFFSICICLSFKCIAQKQIADYTLEELQKQQTEAVANNKIYDTEVFNKAITLRTQMDAATKAEDFTKAAALKEQLKALKLLSSADLAKINKLDEEIKKAVDAKDYAKAEQLKNQQEIIKGNKMVTPATPVSNSTPTEYYAPNSNTAPVSKNSIYNEADITWFGADFSLFTYTFVRKEGKENELLKHINTWQKGYGKEVPAAKLKGWLKKKYVASDEDFVQNLYKTKLKQNWISSDYHDVSNAEIQEHLKNYNSNGKGIGLVLIPELFNEDRNNYTVEFVWFDIATKSIIDTQKITGKGSGGGTLSGWIDAMLDATKTYVDKFYKR